MQAPGGLRGSPQDFHVLSKGLTKRKNAFDTPVPGGYGATIYPSRKTGRILMNHIKTMLCGNFIGIDKLERLKLLQSDPLISEFDISTKEPETVSRFVGNFSYKTTQMLREINFKVFRKLLRKRKLKSITIDIDSSVVNVEGHQEGTAKGYNPQKPGNPCYNIQFAFCDEIKAYLTGYVRSGDTYTANGAAGMIKEIMAHLKEEGLEVTLLQVKKAGKPPSLSPP
jgi:hypothetical protein